MNKIYYCRFRMKLDEDSGGVRVDKVVNENNVASSRETQEFQQLHRKIYSAKGKDDFIIVLFVLE